MLIIDKEMPKNCNECFCCHGYQLSPEFDCHAVKGEERSVDICADLRPEWCPLTEVEEG